jgi:Uma2 family endonuclease
VAVAKPRMTLEEFLALPEEEPALEYEDGVVTQKVSPRGRHSVLQYAVAECINSIARPAKLAWAFPELRSTFGRVSRVPDVSGYTWDRIPRDEAGQVADDFLEAPDIAIEIISPGQSVNAMVRRLLSFVAAGVRAAVLLDPDDESALVVRPGAVPVALTRGDTLDLTDIVPGLRIDVSALFDVLRE